MKKIQLEYDNTFLIKRKFTNETIYEITVLFISENAYKLKYHRNDGSSYIDWVLKNDFHDKYNIIEKLPKDYIPTETTDDDFNPYVESNITTKSCPVCGGEGEIQDNNPTTGVKVCPKCNGNGWILRN